MKTAFKSILLGAALLGALAARPALAQDGAPPPGPGGPPPAGQNHHRGEWGHHQRPELTDDQKSRLKALRTDFQNKRKADMHTLEGQVKSILTRDQLARWEQRELADKKEREAFQRGEEMARQKLRKSGQPVPEKRGDAEGPMGEDGPPPMLAMAGPDGPDMGPEGPPPPGLMEGVDDGPDMHRGWGGHGGGPMGHGGPGGHGGPHGGPMEHMFRDLKLTPEQMGEVKVFHQSFMEKGRTEMKDMMTQVRQILPPPPRRGGEGPPSPPPAPTP